MQQFVRIRQGYHHPLLGDIGGWEAVVLRSFNVQGIGYYDVEFSASTIATIAQSRSERFIRANIVFTRVRIDKHLTSPASRSEDNVTRSKALNNVQRRWFELVGSSESDPTKSASDSNVQKSSPDRRKFLSSMVIASVALMAIVASECQDCACGSGSGGGGSWHRFGGGSSS